MIRTARNASLLRLSVELKSIGLHFGQRIPLLVRRGGCGIKKNVGEAHLSAADGVVAYTVT